LVGVGNDRGKIRLSFLIKNSFVIKNLCIKFLSKESLIHGMDYNFFVYYNKKDMNFFTFLKKLIYRNNFYDSILLENMFFYFAF
jgi:hypothetical protein